MVFFATYVPSIQANKYFIDHVGKSLDSFSLTYGKYLLIGDFNAWETKLSLWLFLHNYVTATLVQEKTCHKSVSNPSCIDLFITNSPNSFRNTSTLCTGLFDFRKLVVTVWKTFFSKSPPKDFH